MTDKPRNAWFIKALHNAQLLQCSNEERKGVMEMNETNLYPVLPLQVGLDIMSRFRRSAVASGKWNWIASFPYSRVDIPLDYPAFSAIVWALFNSVNNPDLPYADRKNSYSVLGTIAEAFGYILPAFVVPGYPKVTAEECKA